MIECNHCDMYAKKMVDKSLSTIFFVVKIDTVQNFV